MNSFKVQKRSTIDNFYLVSLDRVYRLERQLKTPDKFLHPCFETINWYAAVYLLDKLKGKDNNCNNNMKFIKQQFQM